MRQIYTSPRHENVDRVVQLLNDNGIATKVSNRKPFSGDHWKRFSYSGKDDSENWPKVWIVNSNDQIKAREVMREAGLDPGSRRSEEFANALRRDPTVTTPTGMSTANKVRLVALGLVFVGAVLLVLRSFGKI
jgi:hypothetical protein